MILESNLFLFMTEIRIVIFSRFYGLGDRGGSADGFVLVCLLVKRLGILRGKFLVWALCVMVIGGFGLKTLIWKFLLVGVDF